LSRLQKAISRIQRRESPRSIGFGVQAREKPRAMLLGVLADTGAAANSALEAGADLVILKGPSGKSAVEQLKAVAGNEHAVGAWIDQVDDAAGSALAEAGCDFVVSTIEGTAATAVDVERMGQVLVASHQMDDTTLRALAPLGLDALVVEHGRGPMSLASQVQLLRLASFASTPLIVTATPDAPVAELRVLRDSGTVAVVLPAGSKADDIKAMSERLQSIPPRKQRREGGEMALVPSFTPAAHHEEVEEPDEDE
jgi:2-keto-3-deoxy-L-rhamnonate aldolase RhmA